MKSLKLVFISCALLFFLTSSAQYDSTARIVTVSASLQHISDIDFVKQEYKIEIWLKFIVSKEDICALTDLETQIAIKEAKLTAIDTVPNWQASIKSCSSNHKPDTTKTLRIRCTMIQNWSVAGYPFDKQNLNITIYNSQRSLKYFKFEPKEDTLHYNNPPIFEKDSSFIKIENGWLLKKNSAHVVSSNTHLPDPFQGTYKNSNEPKNYTSIHYAIPLHRVHKWFLFAKLLVGMYVAFFVAFIALFINMKHTEVRFSLPVGGLFAAIANKYIMESILPQSPDFTMVDWLHSITIIYILLIIAYSARDLYLIKKANDKGAIPKLTSTKKVALEFAMTYLLITIILIVVNTH